MKLLSRLSPRARRWLFIIFCIIAVIHVIFISFIFAAAMYLRDHNPEVSSLMLYRKYVTKQDYKPVMFMPLKKMPKELVQMVIATEDYHFYSHHGIDLEAIKRAYIINMKVGHKMYGGSTITQQLSRTLFLCPKKLFIRKYAEVIIALELDMLLPKDRILELYLNYCEWGSGIYGLKRASKTYFKKEPRRLNIDQITRLVTILANPVDYNPFNFHKKKFLENRYFFIRFRYYTYKKFHR